MYLLFLWLGLLRQYISRKKEGVKLIFKTQAIKRAEKLPFRRYN